MGENGAGKSTLMKIVAGHVHGRRRRDSLARPARSLSQARGSFAPTASPWCIRNRCSRRTSPSPKTSSSAASRTARWVGEPRQDEHAAARLIEEHHFPLQADGAWKAQPRAEAAGRDLPRHPARLQPADLRRADVVAFRSAKRRKSSGSCSTLRERKMGVIYITHRLEELRSVGDRVTVLRDGETVHTGPLAELTTRPLIQHMVGREVAAIYQRDPLPPGDELLRVDNLTRGQLCDDISFSIRAGEIVGMAGLIGAGRTELAAPSSASIRSTPGRSASASKPVRIRSPRKPSRAGIALIPEDRQRPASRRAAHRVQRYAWRASAASASFGFLDLAAENAVTQRIHRPAAHQVLAPAAAGRTAERRQSAEGRDREVAGARRACIPVR